MSDEYVKDLTVFELKELIRQVVAEEVTKHCFTQTLSAIPPQPFYSSPEYPYQRQEVWADTKTKIINREK